MDQDQNRDNDLFNFDNPPPQSSPDEPTVFAGSARAYDTPEGQQPVEPPPPPYAPPPYSPPPPVSPPPPKSNKTLLIVILVLVLLCCCCLAFGAFMYYVGGDWLLENMELQNILPSPVALLV